MDVITVRPCYYRNTWKPGSRLLTWVNLITYQIQCVCAWGGGEGVLWGGWLGVLLIHSQTSTVAPLIFGNGLIIWSHTLCKYFSMLGLSLDHVNKMVPEAVRVKDGVVIPWTWWRHQMGTFSVLLALYVVNSPVNGEFSAQRPVTRSFDVSLI